MKDKSLDVHSENCCDKSLKLAYITFDVLSENFTSDNHHNLSECVRKIKTKEDLKNALQEIIKESKNEFYPDPYFFIREREVLLKIEKMDILP